MIIIVHLILVLSYFSISLVLNTIPQNLLIGGMDTGLHLDIIKN
jgi:hypothetical protein